MTETESWGPVESAWPTPEDELEDIEVGFRVGWDFLMWRMASSYSHQEDRERAATMNLVGSISRAISEQGRGGSVPAEWWPAGRDPQQEGTS